MQESLTCKAQIEITEGLLPLVAGPLLAQAKECCGRVARC